jgi:Sec-independent protein translocase protein TatA
MPTIAPEIARAVGRTTRDVQQLARKAREELSRRSNIRQMETTAMIAALVAIDRRMAELLEISGREDTQ